MRIALMGMGRLGRSLLLLMDSHRTLDCIPWRRGEPIPRNVDAYWICVSDSGVSDVASLIPQGSTVLHASGALEVDVLRPHRPAGSLHPLQSFPGPEVAMPQMTNLPAAVAGDTAAKALAWELAEAIGFSPFEVSGDRRTYHAAAVIAGNFATTLLAEASRLLARAGVDPSNAPKILFPLVSASIEQAARGNPVEAMTGPFVRGDVDTVAAHLQVLDKNDPQLGEIYRVLGRASVRLLQEEGRLGTEEKDALFRLLG